MRDDDNIDSGTLIDPEVRIHNVMILDRSWSMNGAKYRASCKSTDYELELLKKDPNGNYIHSIIEFDCEGRYTEPRIVKHAWVTPSKELDSIHYAGASGGTPLYNTLGKILTELSLLVKPKDRVLIKVFTDGDDTDRGVGEWNATKIGVFLNQLITNKFWTITFNCTHADKVLVMRMGIPESNILCHDNTAESIEHVATMRSTSTMNYSANVSRGMSADSMTSNFYNKTTE